MKTKFDKEIQKYLKEEVSKTRIGILCGSFKPATLGHYKLAEKASKENDSVRVVISSQSRECPGGKKITAEMSKQIWELYAKSLPNLIIEVTKESPVKRTYDLIAANNKGKNPGSKIINLYCSKKDVDRFDRVDKFSNKLFECNVRSTPRFNKISGTIIRESIGKQKYGMLKEYFPKQYLDEIIRILKLR